MIQPPGEPREQHLGYTNFHKRGKYWKGRYIYWRIFEASKFQNISIGNLYWSLYVYCIVGIYTR